MMGQYLWVLVKALPYGLAAGVNQWIWAHTPSAWHTPYNPEECQRINQGGQQ